MEWRAVCPGMYSDVHISLKETCVGGQRKPGKEAGFAQPLREENCIAELERVPHKWRGRVTLCSTKCVSISSSPFHDGWVEHKSYLSCVETVGGGGLLGQDLGQD